MRDTFARINRDVAQCRRCDRLCHYNAQLKLDYPHYHLAPVGSWGDTSPRIMIVGLAPGLHGAGASGRAFIGDDSGKFLFESLYRAKLSSSAAAKDAQLSKVRITNLVKCLPPKNAPNGSERNACSAHLNREMALFAPPGARSTRVVVALGGMAHAALCRYFNTQADFEHGGSMQLRNRVHLVSSFHPSRLNVNTGRLTTAMMDEVWVTVKRLVKR